MSPANTQRSRKLFSAAAALVLGLQLAPWPTTLQAQQPSTAPLSEKSQPLLVNRRNQRRNSPATTPQSVQPPALQPMPQNGQPQGRQPQSATPQFPKSEVQKELEKLYQKDGQTVPEMVDPRTSQPYQYQPDTSQNGPQKFHPQAAQQVPLQQVQPQQQIPAQVQQQYPVPSPVAAAPVAPKKKGLLGKFFSKGNNEPTQPPAEPPYIPPVSATPITPPAMIDGTNVMVAAPVAPAPQAGNPMGIQPGPVVAQAPQQIAPAAPVVQTLQPVQMPPVQQIVVPQYPSAAVTPQAPVVVTPAEMAPADTVTVPDDGFDAPVYSENTPSAGAQLPEIDFNAPLQAPVADNVELGETAPLNAATEPADPFSDDSLFPGSTASATSAPLATADSAASQSVEPDNVDQDAMVADQAPAEAASPVDENPYSGLTLDADPYSNPAVLRTATATPRELSSDDLSQPESTSPPALMIPSSDGATAADEPPLLIGTQDAVRQPARLAPTSSSERTQAKQEMIASRKGLRGLKGFCPVVLRDDRDLVDAHNQFRAVYNSKTYYLSSSQAMSAFQTDPSRYAPAARGCDVIHLAITGEELEGTLDHAVWYKGRLYLFSSAETMDTFVSSPSSHATLD